MKCQNAIWIISELNRIYPHTRKDISFLKFNNPFEILIMTILSAQTTDRAVNSICGDLFSKYPDPQSLSTANISDVELIIHPTGFYHVKAKNIIETSKLLCLNFGGIVPDTINELMSLPGVGRKQQISL